MKAKSRKSSKKLILVPIDFSDDSRKALRYALTFAKDFGARISLVYVFQPYVYPLEMSPEPLMPPNAVFVKESQKRLEKFAEKEISPSLLDKVYVKTGKPFREIVDLAKKIHADLIVISTHGYTGLKRMVLGSTAESIIRYATCPVLTVRKKEREFIS
jgi:universal stress protein A